MTKLFRCDVCGIVMDDMFICSEFSVVREVIGKQNNFDFCAKCSGKIETFLGMIKNE